MVVPNLLSLMLCFGADDYLVISNAMDRIAFKMVALLTISFHSIDNGPHENTIQLR